MIHDDIINRYDVMLANLTNEVERRDFPGTEPCHLRWMLATIKNGLASDKSNHWLGFTQGVMISNSITTVQAERDFTRPYFTR